MVMLRAKRSMTYGTRRLMAGDEFEVKNRTDSRVLVALKRAELVPPKPTKDIVRVQDESQVVADRDEGIRATDLRRMRKAELVAYLADAGEDADEEMTRDELLERAMDVNTGRD